MAPSTFPPRPPPSSTTSPSNGAPKIAAIKAFSLSSSSSSKTKEKGLLRQELRTVPGGDSVLGKRSRDRNGKGSAGRNGGFGGDSDDSEEDRGGRGRGRGRGKVEEVEVEGFESGGAVGRGVNGAGRNGVEKEVLIIPRLGNGDWRRAGKSRKNLLPAEVQAQRAAEAGLKGENKQIGDVINGEENGEVQWGLSVPTRQKPSSENGASNGNGHRLQNEEQPQPEHQKQEKTPDQLALEALLGNSTKPEENLIIAPASPPHQEPLTETDAYRAAVAAAPDPSTLEDYERIPVEEFGAALLRGMGWDGQVRGKMREVKRRGNLLGLGAKEEGVKEGGELGAWVGRSDSKGGRGGKERERQRGQGGKMEEFRKARDGRRERREGGDERWDRDRNGRDRNGYGESGNRRRDGDRDRDRDRYRDRRY